MGETRSPILAAVHDTAKGLHKAGVMDKVTLREFNELCLPLVEPLEPQQIRRIRESTRVSLVTWPVPWERPLRFDFSSAPGRRRRFRISLPAQMRGSSGD